MKEDKDIFWGRCSGKNINPVFKHIKIEWKKDVCTYCGSMRPSIALEAIKNGAEVVPTDKNYKIYIEGAKLLPNCPANKCYLNHFSESQAVEFVLLWKNKKMKIAYPGTFYSGLCFGIYKEAIDIALKDNESVNK
jgi:hypothetical protein